jgi:hypothetical protein
MKSFAIVVDEGIWPDVDAEIRAALAPVFGRVRITEIPLPMVRPDPSVVQLARTVAHEMGLQTEEVLGGGRERRLARARFAIIWLACAVSGRTAGIVGRALGGRDRKTILHGLSRALEYREKDPAFVMVTDRLAAAIRAARQ